MSPLVYVCARPQQGAAAAEYESFRQAMRLDENELERWDLVRDPWPTDAARRWRGAVVGGSPFNVTDPESAKTDAQRRLEGDLAQLAHAAASGETAALFTCYGIGVATRALGGEVTRAYPEDTGPTKVTLTAQAQQDRLFGGLASSFAALTAHKEGTGRLPEGAVLLATNDACPVQAYRLGDTLYATQFHPEPTGRAFTERMAVYRDDGYFAAPDYDRIAARVLAASLTEPMRILRAFSQTF
ncbi:MULTISPECIES: glutamine amidotransferase-related protein [unclassified Microbacterium]|jgi:GMP synthase (glutamine-hydrolysing)|uniref:glutamine amidotransferase-related protein n=1 Tax=unclassified Microbacterium TaxID=2609290 RepID=UPI00044F1F2A|nr:MULTISPECIES: GMP synthase [unclassified Microbacterium]EXJ51588.1 GMP synthase [Microbacterium sp. MRS-1]RKS89938.1 GMP synthase (glutamine-hydrolysing) [Microbacterium sp. AG790]